jgi:hypothetical protein
MMDADLDLLVLEGNPVPYNANKITSRNDVLP